MISVRFFCECQTNVQGAKWRRNIAKNFNPLSRVHERVTDDRQTTYDRQTDRRQHIGNVNGGCEFTFADAENDTPHLQLL